MELLFHMSLTISFSKVMGSNGLRNGTNLVDFQKKAVTGFLVHSRLDPIRGLNMEVIILPIGGADIFMQIFQNIKSRILQNNCFNIHSS